jgi:5-methylcytosine-specific restriction endonuclease McrA
MKEIVVLNNSYLPIARTTVEKAIVLLVLNKAITIKESDQVIRSQYLTINIPEVIVLKDVSYIHRIPVAYSKKAVFRRDNYTCQMCGTTERYSLTLEHLVPKSRWEEVSKARELHYKLNSWQNTCCLCNSCNRKKSDKLPEEINWNYIAKEPIADFTIDWEEIFGG